MPRQRVLRKCPAVFIQPKTCSIRIRTRRLLKGYGSLADPLRRAATSIPANIAEACGRQHGKDRQRFMLIARGSATECAALIDLCRIKAQLPEASDTKQHVVRVVQMLTRLCR